MLKSTDQDPVLRKQICLQTLWTFEVAEKSEKVQTREEGGLNPPPEEPCLHAQATYTYCEWEGEEEMAKPECPPPVAAMPLPFPLHGPVGGEEGQKMLESL